MLIPKLKPLFDLSYFEVMLVQFAFFGACFIISMPGAALLPLLAGLLADAATLRMALIVPFACYAIIAAFAAACRRPPVLAAMAE